MTCAAVSEAPVTAVLALLADSASIRTRTGYTPHRPTRPAGIRGYNDSGRVRTRTEGARRPSAPRHIHDRTPTPTKRSAP